MEYPEDELSFCAENKKLLSEWRSYIQDKKIIKEYSANDFVYDGFFPYYYRQKPRIL